MDGAPTDRNAKLSDLSLPKGEAKSDIAMADKPKSNPFFTPIGVICEICGFDPTLDISGLVP
jgi:hypothetical protein